MRDHFQSDKALPDCYFMQRFDEKVGSDVITPLCEDCANSVVVDSVPPRTVKEFRGAFFYPGSVKGYGPWTFECFECNKVIYAPEEAE